MRSVLEVLLVLAMLAALGMLFAGLIGLAQPGHDPRRSNVLMRWRVIFQGAALLVLAFLLFLLKS